jgi:hypothetical protein
MNKLEMLFIKAENYVNKIINPERDAYLRQQFEIETDRMHRRGEISFYTDDKGVEKFKLNYAQMFKNSAKEGWIRLMPQDKNGKPVGMYEITKKDFDDLDVLIKSEDEEMIKTIIHLLVGRQAETDPWGVEILVDPETDTFKVYADRERLKFL